MTDRPFRDRLLDPMASVRGHMERAAGVRDQRQVQAEIEGLSRLVSRAVPTILPIGWDVPTAANQAVATTTATIVTGSTFTLGLPRIKGLAWVVWLNWRVTLVAFAGSDDDVHAQALVDFGTGTFVPPDIDAAGPSAFVTAWNLNDFGEPGGVGTSLTLHPKCVFRLREGGSVKAALGIKVASVAQSATVELATAELTPRCMGMAMLSAVPS